MTAPTFSLAEQQILAEASLRTITLATSRSSGDAFYRVLVRELAQAMEVAYVIAGALVRDENGEEAIQTLAVWAGDDYAPNIRYPLAHTPCRNVADQSMCFHSCRIQQDYPLDTLLVAMQAESYIGMPMIGTEGRTLGVLVALDTRPMDEGKRVFALSLLSIFSARAAAELEHQRREAELESIIAERTASLKAAHRRLLEREKLVALGGLVAGVAHAVNTPLGVALTAVSSLQHEARHLGECLAGDRVSRSELRQIAATLSEAAEMTVANLLRAGEVINHFRNLAVAQEQEEVREFPLAAQVAVVTQAYCSLLDADNIRVEVTIDPELRVRLPPGHLTQILANLLANAQLHAFAAQDDKRVSITASRQAGGVLLVFADNGCGIDATVREQLFEPFFTTRRAQGSTGLGLNLVFNLVQKLQGDIEVISAPGAGLRYEIFLPDQPEA
ncbi:sensor histidine kinase [Chitinilyticum litopenaei]|uniref:sensor histidine kinase n=1 Tax=Chitinilyticum litopenaei TaxID=1121276 RepID=UPI00041EAE39|nr:GAF domain-containing sensor histidine kinase [Chitinilyticum litopenaei]